MNIYIDYLPEIDRKRSDYKRAKELVNDNDELEEFDKKDFLLNYLKLKDLSEVNFISINSHGCINPACFTNSIEIHNAIGYKELIETLNSTIGGQSIILNLVGICNSDSIEYYLKDLDKKYKEVWVTTDNTPSIDATFRLIKDGDFDYYVEQKELPLKKIKLKNGNNS
jgi:hypothetical protein